MFHANLIKNLINPVRLQSIVIAAILIAISSPALTDDPSGYVSGNQSDLPPSLEKDHSARSTDPDRAPAYGPDVAKVLVVIFADFECPACRRSSQATHQIAGQFPGEVRIEFRNNPLPSHKTAEAAARAAMAAHKQGKFWEMHDLLFENPRHDQATLEQHAVNLDLDIEKFKEDMESEAVRQAVLDDVALAQSLGAKRTPGYLVNGKLAEGWASWNYFVGQIEREIKKTNTMSENGLSTAEILEQRAIDNHADSESYAIYWQNFLAPNTE